MCWFDTLICWDMIITIALADILITSHNYHFLFVVRTFKIYSFSNFQVCNTVLLAIVTTLYLRSPEGIHLITGSWCFWPTSPHFSHLSPALGNHRLLSVSVSSASLDFTCKWHHTVFVCPWLAYFTQHDALRVHSCCCKWQDFHFSHGWENNIPLFLFLHILAKTCHLLSFWW